MSILSSPPQYITTCYPNPPTQQLINNYPLPLSSPTTSTVLVPLFGVGHYTSTSNLGIKRHFFKLLNFIVILSHTQALSCNLHAVFTHFLLF